MITDLLPQTPAPPPATLLGVHSVNWWGDPRHPDVGWKSDDPKVVARHMHMMIEAGIRYNVMNWRGSKANPTQHAALLAWIAQAEAQISFIPFKIAVQIDVGMFNGIADPTAELIKQLTGIKDVLYSPAYLGNLVLEFGTEAVNINWPLVIKAFPKIFPMFRNREYLWLNISNTLDTLRNQYKQTPPPIMGAAFYQFDDAWPQDRTKTVWPPKAGQVRGPARFVSPNYGRLWFDSFAAAPQGLPYLSIVTWDDFEEGTAMAPMIAAVQGTRL